MKNMKIEIHRDIKAPDRNLTANDKDYSNKKILNIKHIDTNDIFGSVIEMSNITPHVS